MVEINFMKIFTSNLFFLLVIISQAFAFQTQDEKAEKWVDSVLTQMTINEKIGQLFMIAAYSNQG